MKKEGLGVWGVARSVTASVECDRFECRRGPRKHHPQFKPNAAHSAHPFHRSPRMMTWSKSERKTTMHPDNILWREPKAHTCFFLF